LQVFLPGTFAQPIAYLICAKDDQYGARV
jgi:hypothetical protein